MYLEQLKSEEFDAHISSGTFRLAFVGMSNAGKSYRSKILRDEMSFLWYHVDEEIRASLAVDELSAWLGYPSRSGYEEREAQYLELEDNFTKSAAMQTNGKNLVFDTTGSVVHLSEKTLSILRENCLVVHLDVGESSLPAMMEQFFAKPKPVVWGDYFTLLPGESEEAALRRCYAALLNERLHRYRTLAHVNISSSKVRNTTAPETLRTIRDTLK